MEYRGSTTSDIDSWKEVQLVYSSALKEIGTKLEILNDEFQHVHKYNPIEHIKSRIKASDRIVRKLKNMGTIPQLKTWCGMSTTLQVYALFARLRQTCTELHRCWSGKEI